MLHYYSWNHWITFFFIYCFAGWVWESCYVSVKQKQWVNRGFLRLPLLPIYGFGALLMIIVTIPFKDNYVAQYIAGVIAPTILEYITGWGMEKLFKMRYWDYSNQRFNLHGYICLTSSIAWGFFTLIMTQFLHPPVEKLVLNIINPVADYILVVGIGILFIIDTIQSAKAALDVGRALEKMTELKAQLDDVQVQIALLKAETMQMAEEKQKAAIDKVYAATITAKDKVSTATSTAKEKVSTARDYVDGVKNAANMTALVAQFNDLKQKSENVVKGMSSFHRGLLRGNPTAASKHFGAALKELKEKFR